jgi:hypothetical protein
MEKYQFKSLDEEKWYMGKILSSKEYEAWIASLDNEASQPMKIDMLVCPLV